MEARKFSVEPLRLPAEEPRLRSPVVEGIVRRGEVCNWIAAPKTGKTWLVYTLMASMISARPWAGHQVTPGKVLLIDNELHPETGVARLWRVFHQARIPSEAVETHLDVAWVRGRRGRLEDLEATIRAAGRAKYSMVVLDALYRFLPEGAEENNNADMTAVYNHLDAIAEAGDCAILCVHHATKGGQAGKDTMDVGAGAGAIGRAADGHVVFLRHREDGCVTMRAKTRSFRGGVDKVLEVDWQHPRVWERNDLKPDDLWIPEPPKGKKASKASD